MPIERYRINSATLALFLEDERHVAHTVPRGAIVAIAGKAPDDDRFVEGVWDKKAVRMFAQDVRSRGQRLR
jgi:hypothetical protein